jgi:hypothetical protein
MIPPKNLNWQLGKPVGLKSTFTLTMQRLSIAAEEYPQITQITQIKSLDSQVERSGYQISTRKIGT